MPTILVIDDDAELFSLLGEYLKDDGFLCKHAADSGTGLRAACEPGVDAVILDVMLPGMNGFEVLRKLRSDKRTAEIPILMLTARGSETDRVVGLEMGADDYLSKPFSPRELLARLRSLLRRAGGGRFSAKEDFPALEDMTIRSEDFSVFAGGASRSLTAAEMRLLRLLARNAGSIVSRDRLCLEVFGHIAYPGDRSLDMLVSRLRKKIGPRADGSERIKAARGAGYVLLVREKPV